MCYIIKKQVQMGGAPLFQVWDTAAGARVGFPVYWKDDAERTRDRLNIAANAMEAAID